MQLTDYIKHPEQMDRESLYELRSMVALHPYFQTARLLMLQNLFLLHDPSFDEELRKAAIYITDRKVLFQLIEASHYQLRNQKEDNLATKKTDSESRTISLIDSFLDAIPPQEEEPEKREKRMPTPADATVDYVAYLLETEAVQESTDTTETPQLIGHNLIDTFINNDKGKLVLNENPTLKPEIDEAEPSDEKIGDESYFTETLARIYIKQGRYSKALEIISRLSLQYPKKNAYFADQIRFLQKLIINNNKK
jgi:hypothetical protein